MRCRESSGFTSKAQLGGLEGTAPRGAGKAAGREFGQALSRIGKHGAPRRLTMQDERHRRPCDWNPAARGEFWRRARFATRADQPVGRRFGQPPSG